MNVTSLMLFYFPLVIVATLFFYYLIKVKTGQIFDFVTWVNLMFALALIGGNIQSTLISFIVGFMLCYMYLKKLDQWSSRKAG